MGNKKIIFDELESTIGAVLVNFSYDGVNKALKLVDRLQGIENESYSANYLESGFNQLRISARLNALNIIEEILNKFENIELTSKWLILYERLM